MSCPSCGHENREAAKFCESCGAKLAVVCPACGVEVRPSARFCDECECGADGWVKRTEEKLAGL